MSVRMPRGVLRAIHESVTRGQVVLSAKAQAEMDNLGLEAPDVLEVLSALESSDYHDTLTSKRSGEPMFVFKPTLVDLVLYVKVVLRSACIVVSFHEDEDEEADE